MRDNPLDRLPRWLRFSSLQWAFIFAIVIATAVAAYWLQSQSPKRYEATATVLFRSAALDSTLFGSQVFSASSDPERDASTNLQLIPTVELANRAIEAGDLGLTAQQVLDDLKVGNLGPSDLAGITYEADTPEDAARIANLLATEFVALRRDVNRSAVEDAIRVAQARVDELRRQDATDASLAQESRRLDDLQVLAALQTGNVEVTNPAVPDDTPVGSSPRQVALRAALVELLVVVGIFAVARRLRDPVEGAADLEETGLPVLGELPRTKRLEVGAGARTSESFESAMRLLLGNLRFVSTAARSTVIVVQSTQAGEGKSTAAFHMARAAARAGTRVCLVDADLRSRAITKETVDPEGPGVSELLTRFDPSDPGTGQLLDEAIGEVDEVAVLGSGPQPPNPGDLLARDAAPQIVEALRARFELIIIDAPPLMIVSDVAGILPAADAVVVIVRRRTARLHQVKRLIEQLKLVGARPVGTVLNFAPRDESSSYYYGGEPRTQGRVLASRFRS